VKEALNLQYWMFYASTLQIICMQQILHVSNMHVIHRYVILSKSLTAGINIRKHCRL